MMDKKTYDELMNYLVKGKPSCHNTLPVECNRIERDRLVSNHQQSSQLQSSGQLSSKRPSSTLKRLGITGGGNLDRFLHNSRVLQ